MEQGSRQNQGQSETRSDSTGRGNLPRKFINLASADATEKAHNLVRYSIRRTSHAEPNPALRNYVREQLGLCCLWKDAPQKDKVEDEKEKTKEKEIQ